MKPAKIDYNKMMQINDEDNPRNNNQTKIQASFRSTVIYAHALQPRCLLYLYIESILHARFRRERGREERRRHRVTGRSKRQKDRGALQKASRKKNKKLYVKEGY